MTARFCLIAALLVTAMISGGCARQMRSGAEHDAHADLKQLANPFRPGGGWDDPAEFKGAGDITIYQNRQKASGKIDVRSKANGFFSAQIYSLFGTTIATVDAEDYKGSVTAGREELDFEYDDKMSGLPFPGAGQITFAELIKIVTIGIPEPARKLNTEPVSVTHSRKEITVTWADETIEASIRMGAKKKDVRGIAFRYKLPEASYTIQSGRIKDGVAREILVRDVGRGNYIIIRYEVVRIIRE